MDKRRAQLERDVETQRLELQTAQRDYDRARNALRAYDRDAPHPMGPWCDDCGYNHTDGYGHCQPDDDDVPRGTTDRRHHTNPEALDDHGDRYARRHDDPPCTIPNCPDHPT